MTHTATQETCSAGNGLLSSYTYIGDFFIHSGVMTLCDPLTNDVFFDSANIVPPREHPVQVDIPGCCNGRYMAYYRLNSGEPSALLLFHADTAFRECRIPTAVREPFKKNLLHGFISSRFQPKAHTFFTGREKKEPSFNPYYIPPCGKTAHILLKRLENLTRNRSRDNGTVSVLLGRTLCIADGEYVYQPRLSLYELEPDAVYDASALLALLHKAPYEPSLKIALENYLKRCIGQGGYAQGTVLFSLIEGSSACWDGYRSIPSTHWGCDIIGRVHRETALIPGGLAFDYEKNSFIRIFSLTDTMGHVFAVKASL